MIKIHYSTEVDLEKREYTEDNRWGSLRDGEVVTINEENSPPGKEIEAYLREINNGMNESLSDPIAVLQRLNSGTIEAVIPSRSDPETVYRAGDWDEIINDGVVSEKEEEEIRKYELISSNDVIPDIVKNRQYKKQYREMIIYIRGKTDMKKLAVMDIVNEEVIETPSNEPQTEVSNHVLYITQKAPLFDPVNLLGLNSRDRTIAIIDPDTNEEITKQENLV